MYIGGGTNVMNSDAAPTPKGAVRIIGVGANITLADSFVTQTSNGTATYAVQIAGNASGDTLSNINILDNYINVKSTAADGIDVQTCISARVRGNQIFGNSGMSAGFYGINVNSKLNRAIDWVIAEDNYIADFPIGIVAQGGGTTSGFNINALITINNRFESLTPGLMTACLSLDLDNRHVVKQSTCYGNDTVGTNAIAAMFGTYPSVAMLISGNRGGVGIYSTSTTPQGSLVAPVGSEAIARDTGEHYYNKTGLSNGWHQVTTA